MGDAERAQVQVLQPPFEHEQLLAEGLLPLGLGEVREPVLGLVQRVLVHVETPLPELRVDRRAHPVHLALLHLEHEVPVHVVGQLAVLDEDSNSIPLPKMYFSKNIRPILCHIVDIGASLS